MVANTTSELSGEEAEILENNPQKGSSGRQRMKAVVIPVKSVPDSEASTRTPSSVSTRSLSGDMFNGLETPDTSAIVTPAEPVSSKRASSVIAANKMRSASDQALKTALNQSAKELAGSKRKRGDFTNASQLLADQRLAEAMQEAEYTGSPGLPSRGNELPSRGKRAAMVMDSETSSLSEDESEYQSDGASMPVRSKKRPRVQKKSQGPRRKSLSRAGGRPSRAAPGFVVDEDEDEEDELGGLDSALSNFADDNSSDELSEVESLEEEQSAVAPPGGNLRAPAARPSRITRRPGRRMGRMTRAQWERQKLEEAHPEILTLWQDLEAIPVIVPKLADQPTAISRQLKSFQLEGLDWMRRQEKSKWKGGLLGDEMGMGKTIQAVSLIMSDYPAKDPTLVIVPPVALVQWSTEIASYTDGKLKVLIHHNTDPKVKKLTVRDLKKYDVIMISYSGLESIYRKESKGWKRDDGLVKENSRIHAIHYHRLILDEAHNIKTRTTGVAKACFALKADYKWCLSGTPVQNRIGEFFSLLRFLEVAPFASYFCKMCDCAELHWSQNEQKKCTHCGHTGLSHVSIFNQELLTPITQAADPEERKSALNKLRLITDRIMLRRMKRDHTASLELPPKEVVVHNEFFGEIERDFSSSIMSNTTRQFDTYVSRGVVLNNYANIFGLIMQMRQVANHPDLILKKKAEGGQNVLVCSICDETAEEPIRSRCHHEFCRKCARDYVRSMQQGSAEPDCPRCHLPLAIDFDQPDIEQDEEKVKSNSIINRIKMEDWTSSTKIEMLIYDLYKLRSKKQTHKSIVFSQFTSMLQLVEWRLRRAGFNTVMLDGSMSPAQRAKSIDYFMKNVHVEVFLVSLKAGGVALNLTEASRVFIIDPYVPHLPPPTCPP